MRFPQKTLVVIVALIGLAATTSSCKKIRNQLGKMGFGETVTSPGADTPEKTIQDVLRSGTIADAEQGWLEFSKLLHSDQLSTASLNEWKQFRYAAMRKKVHLFLKDPARVSYVIGRYEEEEDGGVTIYVVNAKSDMPTPCTVIRDAAAGNAWRVKRCSL